MPLDTDLTAGGFEPGYPEALGDDEVAVRRFGRALVVADLTDGSWREVPGPDAGEEWVFEIDGERLWATERGHADVRFSTDGGRTWERFNR